ncbi:MAG: hypothetical protein ACLRHY_02885 [[Eubacterium] siraeum]|nr:hypothetical protein [[Eubacterium] siraeum]
MSAATRRKVGIVCGDCYITVKSVVSLLPDRPPYFSPSPTFKKVGIVCGDSPPA